MLVSLQQMVKRIETDLSQLRTAAWSQHKAQPQISRLLRRTGAARAAVSVALSNLHFNASKSVVAAHFSVVGPVVRVTILYNSLTGVAAAAYRFQAGSCVISQSSCGGTISQRDTQF